MKKISIYFFDFYDRFNKNVIILILLCSALIAGFLSFIVHIDDKIINLISVILSILIGLMFNFSSSLSSKVSSEHLEIKYKFKEIRLQKIEMSYKSSYFSIYISILCLILCLFLTALKPTNYISIKILTGFLIFLLIQMFISFYHVLSDMKDFDDYDIRQEKKMLRKKRIKQAN